LTLRQAKDVCLLSRLMTMRVVGPLLGGVALYSLVNLGLIGLFIITKISPISIEQLLLLFVAIDIPATMLLVVLFIVVAVVSRSRMGLVSVGVAILAMICLTVLNTWCAYLALSQAG
jgi:hypothetical protein